MSEFQKFMKANKKALTTKEYAATNSLVDENGKPLMWTIRQLSACENDRLLEEATKIEKGSAKFDHKLYTNRLICACVVNPDLNDKELQDSYGVMGAEDLLKEMVDLSGEYAALAEFVQRFNGFKTSFSEMAEEAKN